MEGKEWMESLKGEEEEEAVSAPGLHYYSSALSSVSFMFPDFASTSKGSSAAAAFELLNTGTGTSLEVCRPSTLVKGLFPIIRIPSQFVPRPCQCIGARGLPKPDSTTRQLRSDDRFPHRLFNRLTTRRRRKRIRFHCTATRSQKLNSQMGY